MKNDDMKRLLNNNCVPIKLYKVTKRVLAVSDVTRKHVITDMEISASGAEKANRMELKTLTYKT